MIQDDIDNPGMKPLPVKGKNQYFLYEFRKLNNLETPDTETIYINISKLPLIDFLKNFKKNLKHKLQVPNDLKEDINQIIFQVEKLALPLIRQYGPFPNKAIATKKRNELFGSKRHSLRYGSIDRADEFKIEALSNVLDENGGYLKLSSPVLMEKMGWSRYTLKKILNHAKKQGKIFVHIERSNKNGKIITGRTIVSASFEEKCKKIRESLNEQATKKSQKQPESNVVAFGTTRQANP